jgi:flagellar biosynthetic protein FliQ
MTLTIGEALDLARYTLMLVLELSAPILLVGMVVGLIISILQAVTQIQEQTLSFVPKMLAMAVITILCASWLMTRLLDFSQTMFTFQPLKGS